MFQNQNTQPVTSAHPMYAELDEKGLSVHPFCEFFQGMEVLQMQGVETKEYIFGIYSGDLLVGHVYFGDLYSTVQVAKLVAEMMPPTWSQIQEYVNATGEVWYYKMHPSQYAFVLNNVLKKIE